MKASKIKNIFIVKVHPNNIEQFNTENHYLSLSRIKIFCSAFSVIGSLFLLANMAVFININIEFSRTLALIHINGLIMILSFLLSYNRIKTFRYKSIVFVNRLYIFLFLILGSLTSINSQRLTGNIDAYIIFTLIASITFKYELKFMLISLLSNHLLLMIGLIYFNDNLSLLITKQLNGTAVLILSICLCFYLYKQRVIEFNNNSKLYKSETNFKKLFNISPTPLVLSKYNDGKIIMANINACMFYGYTEEEFYNLYTKDLYKNKNDRHLILSKLNETGKLQNLVLENKDKQDIIKWVVVNCELIEYNGDTCILTSVTDITEIKRTEYELLNHASTDTLTGILNRRIGMELLQKQIKTSNQNKSDMVVCFVDINGLKLVNDNYGHNEGDYLVKKVSTVIKQNIRSTDIFFRYGGDEFVIVFPNKSESAIRTIWNRITNEFDRINKEDAKPYKINASYGLYEYNGDTDITLEEIIDKADQNMYLNKNKL